MALQKWYYYFEFPFNTINIIKNLYLSIYLIIKNSEKSYFLEDNAVILDGLLVFLSFYKGLDYLRFFDSLRIRILQVIIILKLTFPFLIIIGFL